MPRKRSSVDGKPLADIATTGRPEQCVDQRVDSGVAIRVTGQTARMGDLNAAEPERHAFSEGMHVHARSQRAARQQCTRVEYPNSSSSPTVRTDCQA